MNTDVAAGNGSHWTGLYIDCHGRTYYYDSFGLAPPRELSTEMLQRGWSRILYSDIPRQVPSEQNCGPRSLVLLKLLATAPSAAARKKVMAMIGEV